MKHVSLVLLVIILNSSISYSQNAFYDAIKFRSTFQIGADTVKNGDTVFIALPDVDEVFGILKNYVRTTSNSKDAILKELESNPFIRFNRNTSRSAFSGLAATLTKSIGGLDVTNVADGLAKFLVKRTKEELSVAFFVQFKEDMNGEKYSDLRTLFPQTARLLNLIDTKIYQFSGYLTELRETFILDLNSLPSSALNIVNLPKYQQYFIDHPEMKSTLQSGLFIADVLLMRDSVKHMGALLENIPVDTYFPVSNKRKFDSIVNGSFKTAHLISYSLKSSDTAGKATNTQRYWVSPDSLFLVLNDPLTFKIYLGLLYQKAKTEDISFLPGKKLTDVFTNTTAFINKVQNEIASFYTQLNAFEDYRKQFRKIQMGLQTDSLKLYYYGMINSSIAILENGLSFVEKVKPGFTNSAITKLIPPIRDAAEIFMYINQRKYGPAILSLVNLYKDVFREQPESNKKNFVKLLYHLETYGSFISQVAKAENSDQVAIIIEKTVLPTGSSYIKKHSISNIALQAYTGLYGGQQRQPTDINYVPVAGVYAPLGIAASWGSKIVKKDGTKKSPTSFSLFLSIIDIGPLVSYRFSNENDSLANNITIRLNQILSPGLHIAFGVPKVPLSIGAGGNWTPLLTKVESHAIQVSEIDSRAFRWQIFLAVDIPFLNFYNKPR